MRAHCSPGGQKVGIDEFQRNPSSYIVKKKKTKLAVPIFKSQRQVIIVEDDLNTKKMYESFFETWSPDYEIFIYSSAINALLDLDSLTPALLVTDLRIPNMNGFEFIKTVRKKGALPQFLLSL